MLVFDKPVARKNLDKIRRKLKADRPRCYVYYTSGSTDYTSIATVLTCHTTSWKECSIFVTEMPFGAPHDAHNKRGPRYDRWKNFGASAGLDADFNLYDSPGVAFSAEERARLIEFVELMLLFGWDAEMSFWPGKHHLLLSHDDRIEIWATSDWRGLRDKLVSVGCRT